MERKNNYLILIILLGIMLILQILSLFKKDARALETLKVGGADNMKKIEQLYNSDEYISQQTIAIDQALSQMDMLGNLSEEELYEMIAGEEGALEEDVEENIVDIELE
ncbi:MAG TPA: hypothetical protein PK674_00145 [Candidatus Absconditabacterales bacterium]|nr:hypothetical protein [Candidatus Absconditabacterales bacterium]HOQ78901.1 hypothetical protein [Candidatus Absconditabacterales bacterium]HPK27792.1 hypothetical protein [Candidatus Absconditabacterales bacterium]